MNITIKKIQGLDIKLCSEEQSPINKWAVIYKKFEDKYLSIKYSDEIGMIYPVHYFDKNENPVTECYFRHRNPAMKLGFVDSTKSNFPLQQDCVKIFEFFNEAKKFSDRLLLLK